MVMDIQYHLPFILKNENLLDCKGCLEVSTCVCIINSNRKVRIAREQ
jgi:hypothetical protein